MKYRTRATLLWAVLLLLPLACQTASRDSVDEVLPSVHHGPRLHEVERLLLEETDSVYVGRVRDVAITSGGSTFVADAFWDRVIEYDPQGRVRRIFGSSGQGPGELQGIGAIHVDDTLLLVDDPFASATSLFRLRDAQFVQRLPHDGQVTSFSAFGGSVLVGLRDWRRGTSVTVWKEPGEEVLGFATLPEELRDDLVASETFSGTYAEWFAERVYVGFSGTDLVRIFDASKNRFDAVASVRVPIVKRRGAVPTEKRPGLPLLEQRSALFFLGVLPDAATLLVYHDLTIEGRLIQSSAFMSVLSADLQRACVDTPLPIDTSRGTAYELRGDTLYALEQEVTGPQSRLWRVALLVDWGECRSE